MTPFLRKLKWENRLRNFFAIVVWCVLISFVFLLGYLAMKFLGWLFEATTYACLEKGVCG